MIILHACLYKGELLLWGETPPNQTADQTARSRGRRIAKPGPYAYGAVIDTLTRSLKEAGIAAGATAEQIRESVVWLPTKGALPVPSSPLIAEQPDSRSKVMLSPWMITAYCPRKQEVIELLCACMGRRTMAPGVVAGADLAYWSMAVRFAGSLVARQRYLPGIGPEGKAYRARWEPVLTGRDAEAAANLARGMPHSARALSGPAETSPPQVPALAALKQFVSTWVDYLVRSEAWQERHAQVRHSKRRGFDSVHDAWFHALTSLDGVMEGDAAEIARLEEQVRQWRFPIELSSASPFKLCFRLEEPDGDTDGTEKQDEAPDSTWYVRYLLQPYDDPSLLIEAEEVWNAGKRKASALSRYLSSYNKKGTGSPNAYEHMLSGLGQAAGICPHIGSSLEGARPAGFTLNTTEAYAFLTETAMALEGAGFGVMLPAWWTRRGTKARIAIRASVKSPKMQGGGGLSMESLIRFDWELALGGTKLTLQELRALSRLKVPLVRVRGQWVEMSASEIQAALDFWKNKGTGEGTLKELVRMALGAGEMPGGFEFSGVRATGRIGELLRQLEGRASFEELPQPDGFSGTLRPYQVRGYSWLSLLRQWGLGACLADDMGLGKTVQTLALIERDWREDAQRPVLLVCPTSVVNNWQKEAARFTPDLPLAVHHGVERRKGAVFKKEARNKAIMVSSYGTLLRDIAFIREVPWAGVVLDEAQNIKNPETKQSQAVRSLNADYRIALTGTPVENHVGDLWAIMEFLNPGFLGTQAGFKKRFFIPIQAQRDRNAADRLKKITGPFILRRLKTDKAIISDLPEKVEMKVFCPLTREQASLYAAVLKDLEQNLHSAEGIQRKGMILATLSKLKQVCNHPAQFLGDNSRIPDRSGKLARLEEMLEEVMELRESALIFTQFAEMGAMLQRHVQDLFGMEVYFLHGGAPRRRRDRMVERFQRDDQRGRIFILSLKAGGTGLNLERANHVFHFDRWWNPAVENQATDRAFRIGQTRNVMVHKFICAGTMEERIDEMIERKKEVAETVVGTGEGWLTELSNEELREVFSLRKEAVAD
jgi:hypothetical protein